MVQLHGNFYFKHRQKFWTSNCYLTPNTFSQRKGFVQATIGLNWYHFQSLRERKKRETNTHAERDMKMQ